MEYYELERPLRSDPNGKQFLYAVKLHLRIGRYPDLEEFLNNSAGPKHEAWRIQARFLSNEKAHASWMAKHVEPAVVRFADKNQAILFKLSWDEDENPYGGRDSLATNKVILPIIRRVMPTVIANEIIGVQPMTGPVAQIHTMKVMYNSPVSGVALYPPTPEEQAKLDQEKREKEIARSEQKAREEEMDNSIRDFEEATGTAILPETILRNKKEHLELTMKEDNWDPAKQSMMAKLLENTHRELTKAAALTTINPSVPPATPSSATTSPSKKTSNDTSGKDHE